MNANEAKLKLLVQTLSKKNTTDLAKELATHILSGLKTNNKELHNIFAELAVEISALSRRMDDAHSEPTTDFDASLGKLADTMDKGIVASLSDEQVTNLASHIGETLSDVVSAINLEITQRNLADTVEVKGLDKMLTKLVDKIPAKIDGTVKLAYNKAAAKDYVNVRLTNGEAFIDALAGIAGRGAGLPLIKTTNDVMALPVVNSNGKNISDLPASYTYSDNAKVGTDDYVGFVGIGGVYVVAKYDSNGNATYKTGTTGYQNGDDFEAWASGLTGYALVSEAFA